MPSVPDHRDRVDHVLATIDGALESYGDAMRWSPDPQEEREEARVVETRLLSDPRLRQVSLYSGEIGDYMGVDVDLSEFNPVGITPTIRLPSRTFTVDLERYEQTAFRWTEIMVEARAAFDRITTSMLNVGQAINRLAERLQPPSPPVDPLMPPAWKHAMEAKARRGTGPNQTPWRHRNP